MNCFELRFRIPHHDTILYIFLFVFLVKVFVSVQNVRKRENTKWQSMITFNDAKQTQFLCKVICGTLWLFHIDGSSVYKMHLPNFITSCFNAPPFLPCSFDIPCSYRWLFAFTAVMLYMSHHAFFFWLWFTSSGASSVGTALLSCVIWLCMRTYTFYRVG